jgi:signal transduction histidine kinase
MSALVLSCAALGTLGVLSLADDARRAAARYREQADAALDAGRIALAATVASIAAGAPDAIPFVATTDGALLEPAWASRPTDSAPASRAAVGDAALLELLQADVARVERLAGDDAAASRLRDLVATSDDPLIVPWTLTALGALERRAGRLDAARAAWRRVVAEHPEARDGRGLRRSFAARLLLAESEGSPAAELVRLYDDVVADRRDPRDAATAAFVERVASAARDAVVRDGEDAALAARFEAAAARDRRRARELRFATAWKEGVALWIASGAEGGARSFATDDGAPPSLVAVNPPEGGGVRGAALEVDAVARLAFARPEIASFAATGLRLGLDADKDVLARGSTEAPWPPGTAITVVGEDLAAFREAERRKAVFGAGVVLLVLVVAIVAALATVRAVNRELAAARDREQFVAATTHELKTPLAAIKLLSELLGDDGLEAPRRREFARRIGDEADRLARLVASVLDLAKLEHARPGAARDRFRPLDLASVARETVESFRPVAAARGFDVKLTATEGASRVAGDDDLLRGALLNLLDNAVKYADAPHVVEVEVGRDARGRVALAVSDRGRGVPHGETRRIFEPFTRVGDELTRDRPGVGLGLALVGKAAALHGGAARVTARDGGGSRFEIWLPALDEDQATPETVRP